MKINRLWKKLSSRIVYKNKWMSVREDKVIRPDGKKGIFGVVEKDTFIVVIPLFKNKIALVSQYRYPVRAQSLEFPEGHREGSKEGIKEVATRELMEETGLSSTKLRKLGTLWLAPGHNTQKYIVFIAENCTRGKRVLEGSEKDMKTEFYTLAEVKKMVQKGIIKDSPTIASLMLFLLNSQVSQ
jgi:8-oxo-dGTP pyrophosphatase MutT (NUDIX family)